MQALDLHWNKIQGADATHIFKGHLAAGEQYFLTDLGDSLLLWTWTAAFVKRSHFLRFQKQQLAPQGATLESEFGLELHWLEMLGGDGCMRKQSGCIFATVGVLAQLRMPRRCNALHL